ncbi:MAG TPA: type II secretion system F family protein [Burkholderiaceae bacterium]
MRFDYIARDADGREHKGAVEAADEGMAVRDLSGQGLTPVRLTALGRPAAAPGAKRRVSPADQGVLLRELATLLGAGVSLGDALPSLAEAYAGLPLGPALDRMHAHVRGGGRLSEALRDPQLKLPAFVLALTLAGEASGQLARSLTDAADQLELDRKVVEDLRSALIYPSVLVTAGVLAVFIIFVGVVPRFAPLIRNARADDVPEFSRWTIEAGVFVRANLGAVGLCIAAVVAVLTLLLSRADVRHQLLQTLSRLPLMGHWLTQAEIGRWATVLGTLLTNRVPIVDAMAIASGVLRLDLLRSGLERAAKSLQQGQTLADALASQTWFPPSRLNLVRVGEKSGELPKMLLALGNSQTDSARLLQKRLLTLIEPAAIVIIGLVIGFVMVAVMMAITSMNSTVT